MHFETQYLKVVSWLTRVETLEKIWSKMLQICYSAESMVCKCKLLNVIIPSNNHLSINCMLKVQVKVN